MERNTKQKKAILSCLQSIKNPVSIEEIALFCRKEIPLLNLSTIYRNLKKLIEEKQAVALDISGEPLRYEIFKPKEHPHFLCSSCHQIFCLIEKPQAFTSLLPEGFILEDYCLTLKGMCKKCKHLL